MKKTLKNKGETLKLTTLGFTLIELLAVIVILAVIALITVPLIMNIISDVNKNAFKDSAYGIMKAGENAYINAELKKNPINGSIAFGTEDQNNSILQVKGKKPNNGELGKNKKGDIAIYMWKDDKTCVYKDYTDNDVKLESNVTLEDCKNKVTLDSSEVVYKEEPIIEKAKALVYSGNTCKTDGSTYMYMGGCYVKGTSTNNYVWYSGFLWRLMGINADNTVRLITEENVTVIPWGATSTGFQYNNSHAKDWLNTYFYSKLKGNDIITDQTWCSERTFDNASARTNCTTNLSTDKSKVGLITLDEHNLASAERSYLKNAQLFWTMTPYNASDAWLVYGDGSAGNIDVSRANGFRAVINVTSNTTITAGNGTLNSNWTKTEAPYILNENKIGETTTKKLSETVTSGEYVKLGNFTYRVVDKETAGIKLIMDSYYTTTSTYGSDNTFSLTTGIGQTLDTTVYNWLAPDATTKNKIVTSTWNRGNAMDRGNSYKTTSLSATNPISNVKVGLIKVGEMLSGQSATISSKQLYWTLTPSTNASSAWGVDFDGYADDFSLVFARGLRAVIIAKSDLAITGGNGTSASPYEI